MKFQFIKQNNTLDILVRYLSEDENITLVKMSNLALPDYFVPRNHPSKWTVWYLDL
jgi:hypothetical protein